MLDLFYVSLKGQTISKANYSVGNTQDIDFLGELRTP